MQDHTGKVSYVQKNNFKPINNVAYALSYPIIMYTGATRLIKHEHYLISLKNAHLLELLGQTLPLLIIKFLNQARLDSGVKPIDSLCIAFAILNIIDILVELFINSHVIKSKTFSIGGLCLRKHNSQTKEILLAVLISVILAVGLIFALIGGFGIRQCGTGQYKDGANCLSCQKTLGDLC